MRLLPAAVAAAALLASAACASRPSPDLREGIVDARRERACSFEEMIDDLASVRMVYIGETHTNPEHHEVQRRVLEALLKRRPRLLVGLEMMERPYQEYLDRWCEGGMEEETFLREANWYGQWSDWDLYGPILRLARDCRIRAIALNVDRTYIAEVRRKGLLNVPPWIRAKLPDDIDLSVKAHRKALREVFASPGSHPGADGDPEDRFR
ncbi:MAG TPA: ChaN family lipoprotein, partial [Planctomycetota bacterium]|nr:ChaN family lipoprotein [Planctomycetota bacterium]